MNIPVELSLSLFADASAASNAMRSYITPVVATLCILASLACAFFLVNGGIQYMASAGRPDKLEIAKRTIKNALIGLALVIAAATLTAILSNAYSTSGAPPTEKLPTLQTIEPVDPDGGLVDVLINAIVGLLRNVVQSIGEPFLKALSYFLNSTPLMGDNSSVFNIWLAVVGIADVLFVLVVALIGFHIMSFSTLGFDDIDLKQLLPQLAVIFLLINTSIFAIDGIIGLSNAMIYALQSGFPSTDIWAVLADITKKSSDIGLAGLLVMTAFLVLAIMLLVYYVGRLITLYVGAILSPLVLLLWLLPAFKDFAITALKTYLTTIFVLFVHVVILLLAASIFSGMLDGDTSAQPNTLMALIVGLATVVALLKTQDFMRELSYAASAPRAAREVGGQFIRGISAMNRTRKTTTKVATTGYRKTARFMKTDSTSGAAKGKASLSAKTTPIPRQAINTSPLKTGETRKAEKVGKA